MSLVIGIDLGTSTTEAAIYRDGKSEMIMNFDHQVITPSVVGIDTNGNWVVGEKARAQQMLFPERTAIEVKRKIGTNQRIRLGNQNYSSWEISAKILEYVKTFASEALGEPVSRAVISVPAYFDDLQRQETIMAGQLAGFQVDRILNEPTAAALSYGLDHMEEESHILVYDLGGGTFDVTLLEMFDGVLDVKASSGDNSLGGKDFDQKIMDFLLDRFKARHKIDLSTDRFAMVKIKDEAEACKKALTQEESYRILLPNIAKKGTEPLDIDETITRAQFEKMTDDLIQRTHHPIDVVLSDAGLTAVDIDKIILVGGSTRMPMVSKDIASYLGMDPVEAVNPDLAVAQGAAIQAGIIVGAIDSAEGLMITDVNSYSLGVRCIHGFTDDYMSIVIPRNVTIPVTRSEIYYTAADNQTVVNIEVYQGESEVASNNRLLGQFKVKDIPPKRAGKESINVEFSYDLNGMLKVKATVISTGKDASIEINMMEGKASAAISEGFDNPEPVEFDNESLEGWKDVEGAEAYRAIVRRMERFIRKGDAQEEVIESVKRMCVALKMAILNQDWDEADEVQSDFQDLVEVSE